MFRKHIIRFVGNRRTLQHLIRVCFANPPSPQGKGFVEIRYIKPRCRKMDVPITSGKEKMAQNGQTELKLLLWVIRRRSTAYSITVQRAVKFTDWAQFCAVNLSAGKIDAEFGNRKKTIGFLFPKLQYCVQHNGTASGEIHGLCAVLQAEKGKKRGNPIGFPLFYFCYSIN